MLNHLNHLNEKTRTRPNTAILPPAERYRREIAALVVAGKVRRAPLRLTAHQVFERGRLSGIVIGNDLKPYLVNGSPRRWTCKGLRLDRETKRILNKRHEAALAESLF